MGSSGAHSTNNRIHKNKYQYHSNDPNVFFLLMAENIPKPNVCDFQEPINQNVVKIRICKTCYIFKNVNDCEMGTNNDIRQQQTTTYYTQFIT